MGIPIGTSFTATLRARAFKNVTCEKCGDAYVYVVEREGRGAGTSLLWLDNDGAKHRAEEAARGAVDAALARAVEPIACVRCGHLQEAMVREARRRRGKWLLVLSSVTGAFALVIGALAWAVHSPFDYTQSSTNVWVAAGVAAAISVASLGVRHLVATTWDPNSDTMWKRRRAAASEGRALRKEEFDRLAAAPGSA